MTATTKSELAIKTAFNAAGTIEELLSSDDEEDWPELMTGSTPRVVPVLESFTPPTRGGSECSPPSFTHTPQQFWTDAAILGAGSILNTTTTIETLETDISHRETSAEDQPSIVLPGGGEDGPPDHQKHFEDIQSYKPSDFDPPRQTGPSPGTGTGQGQDRGRDRDHDVHVAAQKKSLRSHAEHKPGGVDGVGGELEVKEDSTPQDKPRRTGRRHKNRAQEIQACQHVTRSRCPRKEKCTYMHFWPPTPKQKPVS